MKSLKIITIVLVSLIIASCSITKKVEKSVLGKWAIVNIYNESQKDTNDQTVKDLLKDSYLVFKEDKTFEISVLGKMQTDSWSISEDGKKILSTKPNIFFEVLEFDESSMKLKSSKDDKIIFLELKKI